MTDDDAGPATPAPRSLADRVNYLFATIRPAGRKTPYSEREVAAATKGEVSASNVGLLRAGRNPNPTMKTLTALARFFGVPVTYFFDDDAAAAVEADLERLSALRELKDALENPSVALIAVKARGLSPDSLQQVAAMIDHVRRLEEAGGRTRHESD